MTRPPPLELAPVRLAAADAEWCGRLASIAEYDIPIALWGGTERLPDLPSPDDRYPTVEQWKADSAGAAAVLDALLDDAPPAARPAMRLVRRRHELLEREQAHVASELDAARLLVRFRTSESGDDAVDPVLTWLQASCPPTPVPERLAPFVGSSSVHAGGLTIGPDGTGVSYSRPYVVCDGLAYPCEMYVDNWTVGDDRTVFTITATHGYLAIAHETSTNDPRQELRSFLLRANPSCHELYEAPVMGWLGPKWVYPYRSEAPTDHDGEPTAMPSMDLPCGGWPQE